MSWTGVVTNAGNALFAQWLDGTELQLTSAAAGTGTVAEAAMMAQTALVNQKQTAAIINGGRVENGIRLKLQISAAEAAYKLQQFGVWAAVDSGSPVMIALYQFTGGEGVDIPASSDFPDFSYTYYATIETSNSGTFSVTIDASALVSYSTMEEAIAEAIATCQPKITAEGLLYGDGEGGVTAAEPGEAFTPPPVMNTGAPTSGTSGTLGQTYVNTDDGSTYVCVAVNDDGTYQWLQTGSMGGCITATSAALTAGSIVLTVPAEIKQGTIVKFTAPCDSSDVTVGVVMEDILYEWRNTLGEDISGMDSLFTADAMVALLADRENVTAYIVNAASGRGYIQYSGSMPTPLISGTLYGQILADFEA